MSQQSYNLSIPTDTYESLKEFAESEETSIADLLRRATKLFLLVHSVKEDPEARLLVERGGETREFILDFL